MKKNENEYLKLSYAFRKAENDFHKFVSDSLRDWLRENGNEIVIPQEYRDDFSFDDNVPYDDESNTSRRYNRITLDESKGIAVIQLISDEDGTAINWVKAQDDKYIVDVVMNFYLGHQPLFPIKK